MTQNLRLLGKRVLWPDDSDLAIANYTLWEPSYDSWCASIEQPCVDADRSLDSGNSADGAYYSWSAATAGTGTYSTTGNASSSLCPKNWRLPTGGSSGEFQALYSKYNSSALLRGNPFTATISGYVFLGSVQSSLGLYWSSTPYSDPAIAYDLALSESAVNPASPQERYFGLNIRCVAK